MTKHLVIPDAHAQPGVDMERFEMAGAFALKHRPDTIIGIGDWADMESLCSYDRGTKSFEGRRYSADVQASRDALAAFEKPINDYNMKRRKNGKKQYKPKKIMKRGNHENRIVRAVNLQPELDGTISLSDLGFEEYGWETDDHYLIPSLVDGIYYNHFFVSGVMGNPISGENPARSIVKKQMASCTAGHSHILDYAIQATPGGYKAHGLVVGCYFEQSMDYAKATEHMWWRGLVLKHNVQDGEYDLDAYSMDRLKQEL